MKYLAIVLGTCAVALMATIGVALSLAPAPIKAEYWVREMMVVKRHIAEGYRGRHKILLAGGSSALFGLDAKQMSEELKVPVLNLGLHAGLPLDVILREISRVAEGGDTVILALEPPYYRSQGMTAWHARNAIAWDRERWASLSLTQRAEAVFLLLPGGVNELYQAQDALRHRPRALAERTDSLDDQAVIAKYTGQPRSPVFGFLVTNLDEAGDIQKTEKASFTGDARFSPEVTEIGSDTQARLRLFAEEMKSRGVAVCFFSCPYLDTPTLNRVEVANASARFAETLAPFGTVLGDRSEAIFPRRLFFDSDLHLNAEGRKVRTDILIRDIERNPAVEARIHGS